MQREDLDQMLDTAARSGASSLYLFAGRAPCLRLQDRLVRSQAGVATADEVAGLVRELETTAPPGGSGDVDALYVTASGTRFRSTVLQEAGGQGLVFRRMSDEVPALSALALPELVGSFAELRSGLVLIGGPAGAGKSTTLAALVARVLEQRPCHVVTLEERFEWVHAGGAGLVHQRVVGRHVAGFAAGLRQAVRQGADVIAAGALDGPDAVLAAVEAAEQGILVLAGVEAHGIVALMRRLDGWCATESDQETLKRLASVLRIGLVQRLARQAHGPGRLPVPEILIRSDAVGRAIGARRYEELPEIMERSRALGMQTRDRSLKELVASGLLSPEEALRHAFDRGWLVEQLR